MSSDRKEIIASAIEAIRKAQGQSPQQSPAAAPPPQPVIPVPRSPGTVSAIPVNVPQVERPLEGAKKDVEVAKTGMKSVAENAQNIGYKAGENVTGNQAAAGAAQIAKELAEVAKKGPEKVKSPFDLKRAGILLGGLALAKILGRATDQDLAEFAQGYFGMLNQQYQGAQQEAMKKWETQISGLTQAATTMAGASTAGTQAFMGQKGAEQTEEELRLRAGTLTLEGYKAMGDTAKLKVDIALAESKLMEDQLDILNGEIEQSLKQLPLLSGAQAITEWGMKHNALVLARNQLMEQYGLRSVGGALFTDSMLESVVKLSQAREDANKAVTDAQRAMAVTNVATALMNLATTWRSVLAHPEEKIRSAFMDGFSGIVAQTAFALYPDNPDSANEFARGIVLAGLGIATGQTVQEVQLALQKEGIDVQRLGVMTQLKIAAMQVQSNEYIALLNGTLASLKSGGSIAAGVDELMKKFWKDVGELSQMINDRTGKLAWLGEAAELAKTNPGAAMQIMMANKTLVTPGNLEQYIQSYDAETKARIMQKANDVIVTAGVLIQLNALDSRLLPALQQVLGESSQQQPKGGGG
jgi:hypothetical protein